MPQPHQSKMRPSEAPCSSNRDRASAKPRARPGPKPRKGKPIQGSASTPDSFIVMTVGPGSIKTDDASRRFIRSHVMKGKNRKPAPTKRAPLGSWINNEDEPLPRHTADSAARSDAYMPCLCPQPSSSDLNHIALAIDMKPRMMQYIVTFFDIMKNDAYFIERYVDLTHFDMSRFDDLGSDPAYVHALMFMVRAYFDLVQSQKYSPEAIFHMTNTISLLQKTLSDGKPTVADSTISVVISLACVAEARGDLQATASHRNGLYHLIKSRGGMAGLKHRPSLQVKSCRLDLAYSLKTGAKPILFSENTLSWNAYVSDPTAIHGSRTPVHMLCAVPDIRLANVWADLREFCMAINLASQTQQKVQVRLYQEVLISAQYRLQLLSYNNGDAHEILRAGMLAFTTILFFEVHGIPANYARLAKHFRVLLLALDQRSGDEWLKTTVWLLFTIRLSVMRGPEDGHWLQKRLLQATKALGLVTWVETREVLKNHLWVDVVNDDPGKAFFSTISQVTATDTGE